MTDDNGNAVDKTYSLLHNQKKQGQNELDEFNDISEDSEGGKKVAINDKTQIGTEPWANLKRYTMGQDYINTFWFKKLDSDGRQILEECI